MTPPLAHYENKLITLQLPYDSYPRSGLSFAMMNAGQQRLLQLSSTPANTAVEIPMSGGVAPINTDNFEGRVQDVRHEVGSEPWKKERKVKSPTTVSQ
jgi:hypothetical protein